MRRQGGIELVEPGNLLELSRARDPRGRFSHVIVVGEGVRKVDLDDADGLQSRAL